MNAGAAGYSERSEIPFGDARVRRSNARARGVAVFRVRSDDNHGDQGEEGNQGNQGDHTEESCDDGSQEKNHDRAEESHRGCVVDYGAQEGHCVSIIEHHAEENFGGCIVGNGAQENRGCAIGGCAGGGAAAG